MISKFTDPSINLSSRPVTTAAGVTLPALDNHTMGTVFEEVIRKFNEETNITDAGRHFTPRDIVELITDLAFVPVKDQIKNTTYRIYDGACGTGGMLTVAEQRIRQVAAEQGKRVSIYLSFRLALPVQYKSDHGSIRVFYSKLVSGIPWRSQIFRW